MWTRIVRLGSLRVDEDRGVELPVCHLQDEALEAERSKLVPGM